MSHDLPKTTQELLNWDWQDFAPLYADLQAGGLTAATVDDWLSAWSRVAECVDELYNRLYVLHTVDTTDKEIEKKYEHFFDAIYPKAMEAEQRLKEKLLATGLEPRGFQIPLRNMRAESDLFRPANLPLLGEEQKIASEYGKIIGAQTVTWNGEEKTVMAMRTVQQDPDRATRERAWRLTAERQLEDRRAVNEVWLKLLDLRRKLAINAGKPDYRAYRWQQMLRFDYTPADCKSFHAAIEKVVVPAAQRVYERRRQKLGLDTLRPWDLEVDVWGKPPLRPYQTIDELTAGVSSIFHKVDPQLGEYFDIMRNNGLLDLDNRKGKAPGGYCTTFTKTRRPFIFMNGVGMHDDVQTLLHEGGHSFHAFESSVLPYIQQLNVGMEFAEVASMGMELLASPYLAKDKGGFYTTAEAARALTEHLEGLLCFWPYMAVVDAFQHWVYENPDKAANPANCDAVWSDQWKRFMVGVDVSGLEDVTATGWHRKLHIFEVPFYYVEYGLAQLGAVQVWKNALEDQAGAVAAYRRALSLGGTVTLPELYKAAGARLAFDDGILTEAVDLIEGQLAKLEKAI